MSRAKNPPCEAVPDAKAIGQRIRALRRARGWNTGELARRVGFSVSACDAWQYGYRIPNLVALLRMAVVFRRKIDFLVRGSYAKPGGRDHGETLTGPAPCSPDPAVNESPFDAPVDGTGAGSVAAAGVHQPPRGLQVVPAGGDGGHCLGLSPARRPPGESE